MHNTPSALPIGTKLAEREGGRRENDFIQTMNEVRGSIKFMFEIYFEL